MFWHTLSMLKKSSKKKTKKTSGVPTCAEYAKKYGVILNAKDQNMLVSTYMKRSGVSKFWKVLRLDVFCIILHYYSMKKSVEESIHWQVAGCAEVLEHARSIPNRKKRSVYYKAITILLSSVVEAYVHEIILLCSKNQHLTHREGEFVYKVVCNVKPVDSRSGNYQNLFLWKKKK